MLGQEVGGSAQLVSCWTPMARGAVTPLAKVTERPVVSLRWTRYRGGRGEMAAVIFRTYPAGSTVLLVCQEDVIKVAGKNSNRNVLEFC